MNNTTIYKRNTINTRSSKIAKTAKNNRKMKHTIKNNCSPVIKGKTLFEHTCMTVDVIEEIKKKYNKTHDSSMQITTTDPHQIWNILNKRLYQCNNSRDMDICWLNELNDTQLRKKIKDHIFVPESPLDWTKNPNEWLSNYDIIKVLKQYELAYPKFHAFEPTPIDFDTKIYNDTCVTKEMCNFSLKHELQKNKTKIGMIFNLDKHTGSGTHWVSMFIDLEEKFIFYFDSTGEKIPDEINKLKERIISQGKSNNIDFIYYDNHNIVHQTGNSECGVYSLFFVITMLTGKTEFKTKLNIKEKIRFFKGKRIPDKYIEKYRKIFFRSAE
jgi:hypothetical protein